MKNKFFVYGTLMDGQSNHRLFDGIKIKNIKPAMVARADLHLHPNGHFPCLIHGQGFVYGQVIEVEPEYYDEALYRMDLLEGFYGDISVNLYNREVTKCFTCDGEEHKSWYYVYNQSDRGLGVKIDDGDFESYMESQKEDY